MSSRDSRSPSEQRDKELDAPEASTSQSKSPAGTPPNQVDDNSKAGSAGGDPKDDNFKDDIPEGDNEEQEKHADKTDRSTAADSPTDSHGIPSQGEWQAIWAPAQNAYYFYNTRTNETTWTNPLHSQPSTGAVADAGSSASNPTASTASTSNIYIAQAAAEAAGIDPSLAYLDPSLGLPGSTPAGTFTAKFNARTGAFARVDARDPSHLSESERAKRMSEVYFDVGAWEKEVEARKEEEAEGNGKKRKRPTKKDLERFKEQKKQKKIAKTAWLRT